MVDRDDSDAEALRDPRGDRSPLRAVAGPLGPVEPPPSTRLCREFKGLTVADLHHAGLVEQLPGRVRSALRHLERGDFAAAERALPGEFAPVLAGPWQQRQLARRRLAAALVLLLVATTVALYW